MMILRYRKLYANGGEKASSAKSSTVFKDREDFAHSKYTKPFQDFNILPNALVQELKQLSKQLKTKHAFLAAWLAKECWKKSGYCTKTTLLTKLPLKNRLVRLKYSALSEIFDLNKDQLQAIIRDLEKAKLVHRVEIEKKWFISVSEKLIGLFLSDTVKNEKGQILPGNVVLNEWFKRIKTKAGHTDFNSILLTSEVIYWSRFFEMKEEANEELKILSKSRGVVPFFKMKELEKKLALSSDQLKESIESLKRQNLLSIEVVRRKTERKTTKSFSFMANFEKLTESSKLNFKFKIPEHLNATKLTSFQDFFTPYAYARKYSTIRTNIYSKQKVNQKQKKQSYRNFKNPKPLQFFSNCLNFFCEGKNASGYSNNFLQHLLNKLAKRFPEHRFDNKQKFFNYFGKILKQEIRTPWETNTKTYFETPKTLPEIGFSQLKGKNSRVGENAIVSTVLARLAKARKNIVFNTQEGFEKYIEKAVQNQKNRSEIHEAFKALPKAKTNQMERYLSKVEGSYSDRYSNSKPIEHFRRRLAVRLPAQTAYRLLNVLRLYKAKIDKGFMILPTSNKTFCDLLPSSIKEEILNNARSIFDNISENGITAIAGIKFVQVEESKTLETTKEQNPKKKILNIEALVEEKMAKIQIKVEELKQKYAQQYPWKTEEDILASFLVPTREDIRAMILNGGVLEMAG